ncbi:MAG: OB-fold nucleic acid binding domain-containing protein [Candidatus Micrarchaeaceae archaeon]
MNINELKVGAKNVTLEATVAEKEEPREVVTKYGKRLNVANLTLKDETGSISLSLWGDDIDLVDVGDKIKITNGYVSEFRGTPQLSVGKYGKMEVIEKSSGKEEELGETENEDRDEFSEEDQDQ